MGVEVTRRAQELTDIPADAVEAAAKAAYEQHRDHADEWPWGMVFARTQEGWRNYARLTLRAGVPALLDRLTATARIVDEMHGHGADTLEGEMWRLRTLLNRIDAVLLGTDTEEK